jgi:hypothetical protein
MPRDAGYSSQVHETDNAVRRVGETSRTAPTRNTPEPGTDAISRLNFLQRSAGNQAVSTLLETQGGLINRQPKDLSRKESATGEQGAGAQKQDTADPSAPEHHWEGSINGYLGENPTARHTLNNPTGTELNYVLRIRNEGHCLLSLETQYEYKTTGLQRAWTSVYAFPGETKEVTNGLPQHASVHLRLFGERNPSDPDQSYCKGTAEATLAPRESGPPD